MWNVYKKIDFFIGDEVDVWVFGVEIDFLVDLVFKGEKIVIVLVYDFYVLEDEFFL